MDCRYAVPNASILILVSLIFVLNGPVAGEERGGARNPRRQQLQFKRLVKDYLGSGDDMAERERIAERTITLGHSYADALCRIVQSEQIAHENRYPACFFSQIENAQRIEATAVLDESEQLRNCRMRVLQLARLVDTLRPPDEKPAANVAADFDPDEPLVAEFVGQAASAERRLQQLESDAIERWLDAKGYKQLTPVEVGVVAEVNRYRAKKNLPPLEIDFELSLAARDHSIDMTRKGFFSHISSVYGKKTFVDRAMRFGASAVAENIAKCESPAQAIDLWMSSFGHRSNILNPSHRRVGIGHCGKKYTMMFGR